MSCEECGCEELVRSSSGSEYCKECGLELSGVDLEDKEYREFNDDGGEKRTRHGSSYEHKYGESSMITRVGKAGEVKDVPGDKRSQYSRIRRWNRRVKAGNARSLKKPRRIASKIITELRLPRSLLEDSIRLYSKCLEEDLVSGRKAESIAAVCVYVSSRLADCPRPVKDLMDAVEIERTTFNRDFKCVKKELGLDLDPVQPEDLIPMFTNRLGVEEVSEEVESVLDRTPDHKLMGKPPRSLVAGAIYHTTEDLTQSEISEALNITTVTVRKNAKMFDRVLEEKAEATK